MAFKTHGIIVMKLTIANISTTIDNQTLSGVVSAISQQVSRDFKPLWGIDATIVPTRLDITTSQVNIDDSTDAIIYVGDSSQDPTTGVSGAYGYHSENYAHLPYGFVYLDVCQQYGETWSCTLSHETLELLADPTAVLTVAGPAPSGAEGQTVYYDLEVCDPTQGDTYNVSGIVVSNFVTKYYFNMAGGPPGTLTNFLNLALNQLGVRPGGYFQYEDASGTHQVDGSKVDDRRRAARRILAGYRRNARRAIRVERRERLSRER